MKKRIIVIAKDEITRGIICGYFSEKGYDTVAIDRSNIIPKQQLVICEDCVEFCGTDILKDTAGAVILDSGYMWPQPVLIPTIEVWEGYRNNLDEYLRNQRESFSLWYSLLEILNESIPRCINPQKAFEAEAMKPWSLDRLANSGVSIPPAISGNDSVKIGLFIEQNPGNILSLPLSGSDKPGWLEEDEIKGPGFESVPVFLQSFTHKDRVTVIAVNGKPVYIQPESSDLSGVIGQIPVIQHVLNMPFARLIFGYSNGPVLSDFCASPDFSGLSKEQIQIIMNDIHTMILGKR